MNKILLAACALALPSLAAAAQAPAPTPAPAPTVVVVPPPTCLRPVLPSFEKPLTKVQSDKLNADGKAYKSCVNTYFDARKAVVDEHNAIAQAHGKAAQALSAEFNGYVDELNAKLAAQPKQSSKKDDE